MEVLPDRARNMLLRDLTLDLNRPAARLDLSRRGLENSLLMATLVRPARLRVLRSAHAGLLEMIPLAVSITEVVCRWDVALVPESLQVKFGSTVV